MLATFMRRRSSRTRRSSGCLRILLYRRREEPAPAEIDDLCLADEPNARLGRTFPACRRCPARVELLYAVPPACAVPPGGDSPPPLVSVGRPAPAEAGRSCSAPVGRFAPVGAGYPFVPVGLRPVGLPFASLLFENQFLRGHGLFQPVNRPPVEVLRTQDVSCFLDT